MCGIVAYIGHRAVLELLVKGLKRLEYRGYDSAGVGFLTEDGKGPVRVVKKLGKVANLESAVKTIDVKSSMGIAHTRWATHGAPSDRNSHPHGNEDGTSLFRLAFDALFASKRVSSRSSSRRHDRSRAQRYRGELLLSKDHFEGERIQYVDRESFFSPRPFSRETYSSTFSRSVQERNGYGGSRSFN